MCFLLLNFIIQLFNNYKIEGMFEWAVQFLFSQNFKIIWTIIMLNNLGNLWCSSTCLTFIKQAHQQRTIQHPQYIWSSTSESAPAGWLSDGANHIHENFSFASEWHQIEVDRDTPNLQTEEITWLMTCVIFLCLVKKTKTLQFRQ